MLMTTVKSDAELAVLDGKKVFMIRCLGCREIGFPEEASRALEQKLRDEGRLTGILTTDYICHPDNLMLRLKPHFAAIGEADAILVMACGVGMQTVSGIFDYMPVYTACDTLRLPGFQGLTPPEFDCGQCGECFLNLTGGICPITACSKSLVNGPCGGTKNGKCEVSPDMDCGWDRIIRKLSETGQLDKLRCEVKFHDYHKDEVTKASKESE